jgi:hypothetical protein
MRVAAGAVIRTNRYWPASRPLTREGDVGLLLLSASRPFHSQRLHARWIFC